MQADLVWIPGPWRGRLAVASRGGDWLDDEASAWRRTDIDVVVSLLEDDEADQLDLHHERQAAADHAIDFISFPIPDRGVPASLQEAVSLMARIGTQVGAGSNVAVHCRQGIGRSGLIAAGVLMTSGASPGEAMQIVSSARGISVPETLAQRRWTAQLLSALSVPKS